MPELLRMGFAQIANHFGTVVPNADALQEQQIVAVGWSAEAQCMRAFMWEQRAAGEGFTQSELEEAYTCPWEDGMAVPDAPDDLDKHLQLLRGQVAYCRAKYPEAPIGGRLLLAEITRERLALTAHSLGPIANQPRTLQQMVVSGSQQSR